MNDRGGETEHASSPQVTTRTLRIRRSIVMAMARADRACRVDGLKYAGAQLRCERAPSSRMGHTLST